MILPEEKILIVGDIFNKGRLPWLDAQTDFTAMNVLLSPFVSDTSQIKYFMGTHGYVMDYYLEKKDWKNYTTSAVNLMERVNPDDIWAVNDIAWNFYEHVDDKANLGKAKTWIQKATEQEIHYEFYDTYSHLLFKTGDSEC